EVEKAHPDVFNILLQVLDDGRLTDGQGRTVDFRNTVIVMTSNLGSHLILDVAGEENYEEIKKRVLEVVGEHFRPEFINRLDEIVVFHPLKKDQVREIAKIQLNYLHKRLAEQDLSLDISDDVVDVIADAGFDPVYGARPLKRVIKNQIEKQLAKRILGGEFSPGDIIHVVMEGGEVKFTQTTSENLV
ncbi:MAG: ATP-dependent Clp protease ATP-binding subunit ClpB, partial [Congregibacter sp.]